ncbi:unnamed protein product [Trichobilharzia szidati]|nr:unnamed protein product [Trichobilharzia szidati]
MQPLCANYYYCQREMNVMGRCGATIQNWFLAIEKGDLSLVQKLWKDISDIDVTDTYILNNIKHENVTGLIIGAHFGHKDVVRWLLKNKANVNWETNLKWRPIHFAAKRGHCATVDMLCSSGALVDPVTMNNETPLSLALQSHMRDTVRKLVHLGAQANKSNESLVYHYVCRGMLVPDNSSQAQRENVDTARDGSLQLRNQSPRTNSSSVPDTGSSPSSNGDTTDFSIAVFDSQVIMNQLQCQSTSYDLELARRKRELIRRLPFLPCMSQHSANQFLQLTQVASRADLPLENRLSTVSHLFSLLPILSPSDTHSDLSSKTASIGIIIEPYLRLFEACLCESHCSLELCVQLSRLAVHIAALGAGKRFDTNGSVTSDEFSPKTNTPSAHIISYILKLLKRLLLKGNTQYRSGILSHISRILSDLCLPMSHKSNQPFSVICSWCDLLPFVSSIISRLIRLGETLDQPLNVSRFAQLVSLIARCLISSLPKASQISLSSRISDLADILVGWSVDSSSGSKDVNVSPICDEIYFGLSHWFFLRTEDKPEESKQFISLPVVNENIREMVTHLLEDSENSLSAAISESTTVNNKRSPTVPGGAIPSSDPNGHFVSLQLFLNVLSSIFGGICNRNFASEDIGFDHLMSGDVSQWIERLLRIVQSTNAYYISLSSQKQTTSWHSSHTPTCAFHVPFIVLDGIQSSVFQLLSCLVQFSDCSNADILAVQNCLISSVNVESLVFTDYSLTSLLDLIFTILKVKYSSTSTSVIPSSLSIYFDSHSKLHHFKLCCKSDSRRTDTPSQKIFQVLCHLSSMNSLQKAVCELALSDLELATNSQKDLDLSVSSSTCNLETLSLFSLSLLSKLMRNMSYELRNELLCRIFEIVRVNCLKNWSVVPTRVRIIILTFLNNPSLLTTFQTVNIMDMLTSFLSIRNISNMESCILLNLIDYFFSEGIMCSDDKLTLFTHLVVLSKRTLVSQVALDSSRQNVFILCANVFVKYALPYIKKGDAKLASYLLHLAQISLSYPCLQVQKAGNDLLLPVGSFTSNKVEFPSTNLYSELLWITTRRPDYSSTALLSSTSLGYADCNNSPAAMITSFPSLPAVAGILGILTRGAPYTQKLESSRLRILKDPNDWIRRLSHLISPLPSDCKRDLSLLQCTSFMQPVLWHAAWAMVEYKLKVAPWANPLRTFFSLEGTLRAFLRSKDTIDSCNGNSNSIAPFYVASSEALAHQTTNRQLSQIQLLMSFLGYLERIIFNATSGFATALPRPSTTATLFFTANENTCTQWYSRIRNILILISNWDQGILQLTGYLDSNLSKSKVLASENSTTSETSEISIHAASTVYVTDVLLQSYLLEGNCDAAVKLRSRVKPYFKGKSLKDFALGLTSARLDCMNKLFKWTSSKDVSVNRDPSELSSHNFLQTHLNSLLINAVCSMRQTQDVSSPRCFSELISIVRQRSATATSLPSLNMFADYYSQSKTVLNDGLQDWLIKAQFLITEERSTSYEISDPLTYSSWMHLASLKEKAHSTSELSACQWACLSNSPQLAQRLIIKAAKCLTLLEHNVSQDKGKTSCFDGLCNVVLASSSDILSKLSRVDALQFYYCLAKTLWLSCSGTKENEKDGKIKAIAMLVSALKQTLFQKVDCSMLKTATQCNLEAEVALCLFKWLESPSGPDNVPWTKRICQDLTSSNMSEQKSQRLLAIASDLDMFSRFADVSWPSGIPGVNECVQPTTTYPLSASTWPNRLLMMATHLNANGLSASVWLEMANWCYARGCKKIDEFQSAARTYIKDLSEMSPSHPAVPVLLKLVDSTEYPVLTMLTEKLCISSRENTNNDEKSDSSIPALISALATFLATEACNEDEMEGCKHHNTLNIHLHQFSLHCPDDQLDGQIQEKFSSHLVSILPQLKKSSLTSDLIQLLHQLLVSITERQHALHMSAAQAYATFLTIVDQSGVPENSLFYKPITKLDITTTTLKFLDLLCSPSRKLRGMISGFLDQANPVLQEFYQSHSLSVDKSELKQTKTITSSLTLGGPTIWGTCLPQVLIQLGLPDGMIRNCLVALLNRLIVIDIDNVSSKWSSPSYRLAAQLVFPAVVAASNPVTTNTGQKSNSPYFTNSPDHTSSVSVSILKSKVDPSHSFSQIVAALRNSGLGDLVERVEIFTYELQRITVLWEELWLGSLVQHLDELSKKINILESELKRTEQSDAYKSASYLTALSKHVSDGLLSDENENAVSQSSDVTTDDTVASLSVYDTEDKLVTHEEFSEAVVLAKYIATLQPTLDLISQLNALTMLVKPETPHEEWFQKTFGHAINELQETLSHPADPKDVKEPILIIRRLIQQLQTSHQSTFSQIHTVFRGGGVPDADIKVSNNNIAYLHLCQLSPRLSNMHFENCMISSDKLTCGIPLPGHYGIEASHLGNSITILPTKTRPKRLLLRAQNGRTYPYLLKGLEDLRLDDRIMRLFEITNLAAVQLSSHGSGYCENMLARTYSVTPLGVRSGLLQMVQGAVPLYSLYKKWQIRTNKLSSNNSYVSSTAAIPRPGELFHARLKELLHASGQQYQSQSRSHWPLETLREVLTSLEAETPADLLTRELWASNSSCASWWRVSRAFAKSAGLLSSLGYLVGLGDRHLDNLLIDLSTGHIVHIDCNVCFDKGKSLKVAERVPFRLTRILRHALGPAAQDKSVRGSFRFSAENGLQAARHIVDPLLMQLKAFLIDPLVDWQNKKHSTNNSQVVTDFIHLSAFHGGGSTSSRHYHSLSTNRRLRRVDSELRMYSGLLTLRLVELSHSSCLDSVFSVLDSLISRLAVWTELTKARQHASLLNDRYITLQNASRDDLLSSERHCQQVEQSERKVEKLYEKLSTQNNFWMAEILSHFQNFSLLTDPEWLPPLLESNKVSGSPLVTALSNYHSVARIYLGNSEFTHSMALWLKEIKQFHSQMESLIQSSHSDIDSLVTFISSNTPQFSSHFDSKLASLLEQATKNSFDDLCELRKLKDENISTYRGYLNSDSVTHEVDNLNLFICDQGAAGVTAYSWALLDYVLSIASNSLALEVEFKEWSETSSCQSVRSNLKALPLDPLNTYADCLVNLFTVLGHQPTGVWNFSAGYEADVRRELSFLLAVKDSVSCISQLHANLTRLLVPEAMTTLITAKVPMVSDFCRFVMRHINESDTSNLKKLVDDFILKDPVPDNQGDLQVHHVLVAVHLALTNATAQMEEIAERVRSCTITALAWYYVDIISQVTNVLVPKSLKGATSLWKWEFSRSNRLSGGVTPCSWTDEIYTSGMMAFVSILEDGLIHWHAIHHGSVTKVSDLNLQPFNDPINSFIGRLSSRIALASMVGLASGRLFCALVENTGLSIRRLLAENEPPNNAGGMPDVLSLSAEKIIESVHVHMSLTQPVSVQHLRGPAANLIHRLVTRSGQESQFSVDVATLEATEQHYKHLRLFMSAYNWRHMTQEDEKSALYQHDPCVSLANVLDSIRDAAKSEIVSTEGVSGVSVDSIAFSICYIETCRVNGLSKCPSFLKCMDLVSELKQTKEQKEKLTLEFSELDRVVCTIKDAYALDWPILNWFPSSAFNDTNMKSDLFDRFKGDLDSAEFAVKKLQQRLTLIKQEFIDMCSKSDLANEDNVNNSSLPVVKSKRASRNLHHSKSKILSVVQPSVSPSLSSDVSTNSKQLTIITSLRSHLSTLQKEKLSDIRQLVKFLSRYDSIRSSLLSHSQVMDNKACSLASNWSIWLDDHQNWTTLVLNMLKNLSKLIMSFSVSSKSSVSDSESVCEGMDETEFAMTLNRECVLVKYKLIGDLILPLLVEVNEHVTSNPYLYNSLKGFMQMLNMRFKTIEETFLSEIKELAIENVQSVKTEKVKQKTVSGRSLNRMALSVWNRVYDRLHGFDSFLPMADVNEPMSIYAQIDACIRQATDVDNLALISNNGSKIDRDVEHHY